MPGRIPWSTIANAVKKVSVEGRTSVPVSGDIMDMMQMMELPANAGKKTYPRGKGWMANIKPQALPPIREASVPADSGSLLMNAHGGEIRRSSYQQGLMEKTAWIFSLPLGTQDVTQAPLVPKYLWDAAHGGSKDDPRRSAWRSLGMAGLGGAGVLFGLGFAGMGMRDLGLKMSLIAKRALKNKALTVAEKNMAHRMDVPAYTRFGKGMGDLSSSPYLSKPLSAVGTAAGGIAHPFNKFENYLTEKIVKGLGAPRSKAIGDTLHLTSQGRIFDNPAVRTVGSAAALPFLIGGDAMFAPYQPADKESMYKQGFMIKASQFRSVGEMTADAMGGGTAAQIVGGMAPYVIPFGVGSAASLYDAGAQVGNMFSADKTMGERAMHGAQALGNVGFVALNFIPGGGVASGLLKGLRGAAKIIPGGTKAMTAVTKASPAWSKVIPNIEKVENIGRIAPATMQKYPGGNYITGNTGWQQAMKNWGTQGGKVAPGFIAGAKNVAGSIGASPWTHVMVPGAGSAAAALSGYGGGEQDTGMQQAIEQTAKGLSAYRGPTPWQRGAMDYYRGIR